MNALSVRTRLPNTVAALAALLLLPSLALLIWPRAQAVGLARLLAQAQLMQSFGASLSQPPPALWRQRLGPVAAQLWSRQQGVWWQFWGTHGDAGAYLVLPALSTSGIRTSRLPAPPLQVDDVVVFAADPLSRQALAERLRTQSRPQRGLEQRCLLQLRRPQTVAWNPGGMGVLTGPVAPLLQRLQQGCLTLQLDGQSIAFQGEAGASEGVLASAQPFDGPLPSRPLPADVLLQLQGPSFDVLLQGLLARQLVREPLAARYGITQPQLALLKRLPFVLRLRQQPAGPFQASLEVELAPEGRDRSAWIKLLSGLRDPLKQQGLQDALPQVQARVRPGGVQTFPSARWSDERNITVGGWFWGLPPGSGAQPRLVLYLGPTPTNPAGLNPMDVAAGAPLQLRARPAGLSNIGLWPGVFPALVSQADQLELLVSGGAQQPLSQLKGRLVLNRSR